MITASYGRRAVAYLADNLLVSIVAACLLFLVQGMLSPFSSGLSTATIAGAAVLAVLLQLAYSPLTMLRDGERRGQTLGKQWMGVRVIRTDGYELDIATVLRREILLKNLLFTQLGQLLLMIPFLANVLWPLGDERGQALHDKMADTVVVSTRPVADAPAELGPTPVWLQYAEAEQRERERVAIPVWPRAS